MRSGLSLEAALKLAVAANCLPEVLVVAASTGMSLNPGTPRPLRERLRFMFLAVWSG